MHIADLLARRPVPAAGVFLTLTRRCPLSCAHCSTNSMRDSEEHGAEIFSEFAATFSSEDHPEAVWLTGGEPLLRPDLVEQITRASHAAGAKVVLITGLYFARRDGNVAPRLLRAMLAVDHVIVSQDIFHEREVPRAAAFATVRTLVAAGQDVSFQVVGRDADDPYLAEITAQIRQDFRDGVPALVAPLGAAGRATAWLPRRQPARPHRDEQPVPAPCTMAAWPVLTFDGTVVACCRQRVVDGPAPDHLRLGRAPRQSWPEVARAVRERPILRALRVIGPQSLAHAGGVLPAAAGYCGTCETLSDSTGPTEAATELVGRPTFPVMESQVRQMQLAAGPEAFARRYGISRYAHMLTLGHHAPVEVG